MQIKRRKARIVKIGKIGIGGTLPIAIQSMVKSKTSDIQKSIGQIEQLDRAGCEIVRLAVKDLDDARAIKKIRQSVKLPLIADIHFDWRLALAAMENGAQKIRLNPGNIYKKEEVCQVASSARQNRIPIRVGANSGSLKLSGSTGKRSFSLAGSMVEGVMDYIRMLEGFKFYDIVVSLKASNILDTVQAYTKIARLCDYPLHLGVTATGPSFSGAIKSSIALGMLLKDGIGDTLRVSLTDTPTEEVRAAKIILEALNLRNFGPEIISCPTCGRCEVDLIGIVKGLEARISNINHKAPNRRLKLAVMGCVVNGPGEAAQADIGVAFGRKEGLLFKKGKPIRKVNLHNCIAALLSQME